MIFDWLALYADLILASGGVVFAAVLLPTLWNQRRRRASTVTMLSSVPSVLMLIMFTLVYSALGLWITAAVEAVHTVIWIIIASQRFIYGGGNHDS